MTKALLYLAAIGFTGILSIILMVMYSVKKDSKYQKIYLFSGIAGLVVAGILSITFVSKVFHKIDNYLEESERKSVAREKAEEERFQEQIKKLKEYEPEMYKGQVPEEYYTDDGFRDWWRYPLVYPYSINCVDDNDRGTLHNDYGKTDFGGLSEALTPDFDKFIYDKDYIAGHISSRRSNPEDSSQYFLFRFSDGEQENISDKQELKKKLIEIKFSGDTTFLTIEEYSDLINLYP